MTLRVMAPGRVLDSRYRLIEKLGAGGQGEVWRAHDTRRGREIGLKVLNPKLAQDARAWASLEHEHSITSRLDHPSILKIDAPERIGDLAVLPMELAPGGDLRRLRCMGYLEIVPVLIELAQALEHAHERGVIHRDLKPGNVLFDAQGRVKLADFGVAGTAFAEGQATRGHSPFSASPEQLRGDPPRPADDIYGLGALAYELLSGYPPHYPRLDTQRVREEAAPELVPSKPMPPLLGALVSRMLDKDPQRRPRSMREVIDGLDTALHDTLAYDFEAVTEADLEERAALPALQDETIPELPAQTVVAHPSATDLSAASSATLPRSRSVVPQTRARRTTSQPVASVAAALSNTPAQVKDGGSSGPPAARRPPRRRDAILGRQGTAPEPWRNLGLAAAARPASLPRMRSQWPLVAAAGAVASAALIGVIWMMQWPKASGEKVRVAGEQVASSASAPAAPVDDHYQAQREGFDRQLAALEARGAGVWGGQDFASAKTLAAESIGAHDAGNIPIAENRLDQARALLEHVEQAAPQALAAQIAAGERAVTAGQQELALQAFDLARRIDPTDRRIAADERRARGLNGLLPLLAGARNAENAHNYTRAVQDYSRALAIDPSNSRARQGLARANAAYEEERFAKAIGAGFTHLGAGRLSEARAAFEKARSLRPQALEVSEGLKRVAAASAARTFAAIRQRAADLEAQERWQEASQAYDSALQQDPSMVFALEGKQRASARASLGRDLQDLIDHPEQITAPASREEALSRIRTASAQPDPGPMLQSQLARLKALTPDLDRPVHLSLVSDNATQVAIPSIGTFGTFGRRDIELKPGKYTVVGTREGYRDVRRDITVAPGQENVTINVACSDRTEL
jgi:serine/threonine protein kinase/tetratricopeptide (TPR) repeat protein